VNKDFALMLKKILGRLNTANLGLVLIFGSIILIFALISPVFRTAQNLRNILSGFSHIAIMSVGMAFPLITGGIDLSVGAIMGLVGMIVFDLLLIFHVPGWVAILGGLVAGALLGYINALLINRVKLQPFIATLATMVAYRGLTYGISGRQLNQNLTVVAIKDPVYKALDGRLGQTQIPLAFIYLLILVAITYILLKRTRFGINLYAVGGNETAARLAGLDTARIKTVAYVLSGLCSAIAALIHTTRMGTSQESHGLSVELSAIAAAIIGGVSLNGGKGNTVGPALGAFLIGTLFIGLTILGVTTYAQPIVIGGVLLLAVAYDRLEEIWRHRKWLRRQYAKLQQVSTEGNHS
jgi:ribose/xylose/arabinose/galactoside ABC-type transport system permease subunit